LIDCVESLNTFFGGLALSCLSHLESYYQISLLGWWFKAWTAA
jgi:hypothetical protein